MVSRLKMDGVSLKSAPRSLSATSQPAVNLLAVECCGETLERPGPPRPFSAHPCQPVCWSLWPDCRGHQLLKGSLEGPCS